MPTLYTSPGSGSLIVEGVFALLERPLEIREVDLFDKAPDELRAINPLAQVPTLVLDDGTVMTESAAIVLWALEDAPGALAPAPGEPGRAEFLRWLMFFAGAIYPMYTFGDVPRSWVGESEADALVASTVARTLACWAVLEDALGGRGDYLLGDQLGALDLYAAVFSRWRPGRAAIGEVAPRVIACAERTRRHPVLAPLFAS